jgi:hypothetical protein
MTIRSGAALIRRPSGFAARASCRGFQALARARHFAART